MFTHHVKCATDKKACVFVPVCFFVYVRYYRHELRVCVCIRSDSRVDLLSLLQITFRVTNLCVAACFQFSWVFTNTEDANGHSHGRVTLNALLLIKTWCWTIYQRESAGSLLVSFKYWWKTQTYLELPSCFPFH